MVHGLIWGLYLSISKANFHFDWDGRWDRHGFRPCPLRTALDGAFSGFLLNIFGLQASAFIKKSASLTLIEICMLSNGLTVKWRLYRQPLTQTFSNINNGTWAVIKTFFLGRFPWSSQNIM